MLQNQWLFIQIKVLSSNFHNKSQLLLMLSYHLASNGHWSFDRHLLILTSYCVRGNEVAIWRAWRYSSSRRYWHLCNALVPITHQVRLMLLRTGYLSMWWAGVTPWLLLLVMVMQTYSRDSAPHKKTKPSAREWVKECDTRLVKID